MEGRESTQLGNLFKRLHADIDTAEAFEIGRSIESLASHPGWVVLQALLAELRSQGLQELTQGGKPLEAAEYAQRLGFLNGVQTAQDAAATVIAEVEKLRRRVEQEVSQAG